MTAPKIAIAAAPCPVLVEPSGFADRLGSVCEDFLALWAATPSELPELGMRVGFRRQCSNARAAAHLIDDVAGRMDWVPEHESERGAWRERLQHLGQERLGWPEGYRRLLFGDAFYEASVAFAREARAFDSRFTLQQLGQALRNVWIGNSLQMLLDRPVELCPGLFAYSMLYPITDNWLDDPEVSNDLKRSFNARLASRLAGVAVRPVDEREAAVGRLVGHIEQEFPRVRFPSVYASLLAICSGQSRSLDQHGGTDLTDAQLLSISFAKGGSSVLTDLYLVAGVAGPSEERFAFGYGVFLQLLDDLQDVEVDLAVGHETLFTRAARWGPIDEPTARLARFIDIVLDSQGLFDGPEFGDRLDLIRRNCRALLIGSVAEYPKRFSRRFRRHLARQWPVSFRSHRRLRRRALKRWGEAMSRLCARSGSSSVLDLLAYAK